MTYELSVAIDRKRPANERGDEFAAVFSRSLARQSVLCDLLGAQPGVLEHNVSVEVVVRFKRSAHDSLATLITGTLARSGGRPSRRRAGRSSAAR